VKSFLADNGIGDYMSGNILTPSALWGDFKIDNVPACTVVDQKQDGKVTVSRVYIEGRKIGTEQVRIFATIAKDESKQKVPAILLIRDIEDDVDERLIVDLANKGYKVLSVDLAGAEFGKEFYTEYPSEINYANYEQSKDNLYTVKTDASETCWYEWACVARYALKYLSSQEDVTLIGGFGIAEGATVLWQVASMDEKIKCAVFALNAGWVGYRGIYKFGGSVEPQFTDNQYKFLAGVEPQSYAMHVKCPTLMLSATNSYIYDCDRAYDTVSRIDKSVYKAVNYSTGYRDRVSGDAYQDTILFFDAFLKEESKSNISLPEEIDIRCDLVDGKLRIEVELDTKNLKDHYVYVSEEITNPSLRCWYKIDEVFERNGNVFVYEYQPYHESGIVTMFAQAHYKDGFALGSNIIIKKFKENEVKNAYKSNILYSSRIPNAESVFIAANQGRDNPNHVNVSTNKRIKVLEGPMGIKGAFCEWGLLTFKINAIKDKPNLDAMLMLDVYSKEESVLTVKLISDYFGARTEYAVRLNIRGGDVWHNVKLEKAKFKTAEGMSLKSYDKVNAIEIDVDGKQWLINNALWV